MLARITDCYSNRDADGARCNQRCCQRSRQWSGRLSYQALCLRGALRAAEGGQSPAHYLSFRSPPDRGSIRGSGHARRIPRRQKYRSHTNGVPHPRVHDAQSTLGPEEGRHHQRGLGLPGHRRKQHARRVHETTSLEDRSRTSNQADPHSSRFWISALRVRVAMKLSIRARLTLWFSSVVALIILLLGIGIFYGATGGLQSAADLELKTGLDGVSAFIQKKFVLNQMGNLTDEIQEHSSLLPRGKMLRVRYVNGPLVYEAEAMKQLQLDPPRTGQTLRQNVTVNNRPFRAIGKDVAIGPNLFQIEIAVDQTEYAELKERLIGLLIFSLPAGVLLAAFAGYWTSNRILVPLNRITETASSIDARNLGLGLPLSGTNDELDRLSKTLNHMLERIHASYERIAQFTADASHELRTPVALIRSNTELLLMEATVGSRFAVGLSDVLLESEYMAQLISDLLTLARADGSGSPLAMEIFELAESADAVLARARALAATKDIRFHYRPFNRVAPLYGN